MSEPKLISPLLDNFIMGDPISEHAGVRCCPAIKKDTDDKYIVKIISVPASQTQMDALLLSGAYSDKDAALAYFSKLSDSIIDEVNVLNKLSELEGFMQIDACQIEPMEDGNGFDVYLLSGYHRTLERQLRRSSMTHLSALNLGLDLCAALAVARRMGYLYVDLKPGNIYLNEAQGYRIGDIGFLKLDSLKYTSLPDRYRSAYTAPEITDAYSALNTTIDVYAAGLILYQIFNDGLLPFKEDITPAEQFPAPAYADYEMAEIILKACSPNPDARWQDPVALGQALVDYMQRNGAHDTPIVPVAAEEPAEESSVDNGLYAEDDVATPEDSESAESAEISDQITEQITYEEASEEIAEEDISEEAIYTEDSEGNLTFLEGIVDETMEAEDASNIDYDEVTNEVSDMLLQADELIAHETPEPVVQPDPIDVPIPPPIEPEEQLQPEETADDQYTVESADDNDTVEEVTEEKPTQDEEAQCEEDVQQEPSETENAAEEDLPAEKKHKAGGWILKTVLILLAAAVLVAGFFFYKTYYLQTIDAITLVPGGPGELTVSVLTQVDESDLSVICTDTYGIQHTSDVIDGNASFTGLTPNSAYTIKVVTAGFHLLVGNTTASYVTPDQTEVVQFAAVTGSEDGSVILSFTIKGPDSEQWVVTYTSDSGTKENITFTGHMVTLSGLTVGNEYDFTLAPETKLEMTGVNTVQHTVRKIIKPENLVVTGCVDSKLTAQWTVRNDTQISGWTVRCYNDIFDETIVVAEATASFEIPDDTASYTVEVTAAGMSVSERTFVSANSISVKDFVINASDTREFHLSWVPVDEAPNDGWVLQYSVDNSAVKQIPCSENSVSVSPVIPGSDYCFVLQTTNGETVLGGTHFFTTDEAKSFKGYSVEATDMEFKMCLTPSHSDWDRYDLSSSDYTTEFSADEKASFLVRLKRAYDTSSDTIDTLFVIRDENGAVVNTSVSSRTWRQMWYRNYCELDIPSIPQTPGEYSVSVYFNGAFVNETAFTVTE